MKKLSLMVLLFCVLVFPAAAAGTTGKNEEILARWKGGMLGKVLFEELYDPSGTILAAGGERLRREVERAVSRRVADWEKNRLARLYWKSSAPDFKAEVQEKAMREYYRAHMKDLFTRPLKVDFEMLFMRCSREERKSCREEMEKLREDVLVSGDFSKKIEELRPIYGRANGSFYNIDLKTISADVASVLSAIHPGETGPLIETPIGIFLPRLLAEKESGVLSFDEVRDRIRADLASLAADAWIEALVRRVRAAGIECNDSMEALAAAARLEKLDEDPVYLREKKLQLRRELAIVAMEADSNLMPSDDELREKIRENPDLLETFRQRHLLAALIDASKDRYRAFQLAERVRSALASAGGDVFGKLGDLFPDVELRDLGLLSMPEIIKLHPKFGDTVREMQPGDFRGPIRISANTRPVGGRVRRKKLPPGFAFLYLESIKDQPLEVIREPLLRAEASERLLDPTETVKQLKVTLGLKILTDGNSRPQPDVAPR